MTSTPTLRPRTSRDAEPDLDSLVVTHRAIRQDLGRLADRLTVMSRGRVKPVQARAVSRYTAALLAAIRAHHENENDIIWPLIAATARQAVDLAPLADDRLVIEEAWGRTQRALTCFAAEPAVGIAALQASISELRDLAGEHIADEEAQLLPAMRRYLPAEAYQWAEQQIMRHCVAPGLGFTAPWLARHARHGELRPLLAAAGWRVRVVLAFSRRYARLERRAFGSHPSPPKNESATMRRKQT
jgi:hemerythrin-like domain-containing protein